MATRRAWRDGFGALCTAAALALAAPVAGDDTADLPTLAGEYRHSAVSPAGQTRHSVATIAPRGGGLGVAWQEDAGNLFGGVGVTLDGVFGAAYTEALNGAFRGSGVLAYRIDGGTLDGVRLPYDAGDGELVRETLRGSPLLTGSYAIARSSGADGTAAHPGAHVGRVEIERQGDTYQMTWYTPERSYEGVGLRIGDVLVAGYARGFAPGVIAYCADRDLLSGIATYGHSGLVSADRMLRSGAEPSTANATPSARCRAAIEKWNPSLPRG